MEKLLADSSIDIVTVDGLPLGCATKSFSKEAMNKVLGFYATEKNDTGFIYYFTKTGLCEHVTLVCENALHQHSSARLTLDHEEDLRVFELIFKNTYQKITLPSLGDIIEFLNKNPEILEINSKLEQDYWERTNEKAKLEFLDQRNIVKKIVL